MAKKTASSKEKAVPKKGQGQSTLAAEPGVTPRRLIDAAEQACNLIQANGTFKLNLWWLLSTSRLTEKQRSGQNNPRKLLEEYLSPAFESARDLWNIFRKCGEYYSDLEIIKAFRLATPYPAKVGGDGPTAFCEPTECYFESAYWYGYSYAKIFTEDFESNQCPGTKPMDAQFPLNEEEFRRRAQESDDWSNFSAREGDFELLHVIEMRISLIKEAQRATGVVPPFSLDMGSLHSLPPRVRENARRTIGYLNAGKTPDQIHRTLGISSNHIASIKYEYYDYLDKSLFPAT